MRRLFAIGDIHGCFETFHELVINRIRIKKSDRLILLGDYIDRGPRSREVTDLIMDLIKKGFDVTPLAGNHEAMLLESYTDPGMIYQWYMNSGETTLQSMGVDDVRKIGKEYLDFFSDMKFFESAGDFLFVHAGFNDNLDDPFSDTYHMIWSSHPSYSNPLLSGKTIVHGHRPKTTEFVKQKITERSGVIPIDTGCVYGRELGYGFLSALEVNTMELVTVPKLDP
ncbi:MAG TPA: metallophosphoesterase family protein [Bacteroidales bacterium]|nr:metallophosphoesterase family protein [Bacteroidales bacterium]HPF01662.1 metallophosphoesterase family protein [Bacteroidales bacterium]HPJ58671.1 metallophosphoesterase family protein [Bacteroidales bacterium]HPR12358.1 metallophosphoesterase family protein [Bacteroidales bacterium]HRW84578.1 metallophosphoesterase family protein [Bacteroidales bacterium]